jgi:hypothetical protein
VVSFCIGDQGRSSIPRGRSAGARASADGKAAGAAIGSAAMPLSVPKKNPKAQATGNFCALVTSALSAAMLAPTKVGGKRYRTT